MSESLSESPTFNSIFCFSLSDDNGLFYVEFVPQDVGTYIMDIYILGQKIAESPIFYKVYDSGYVQCKLFFLENVK